MQPIKERFFLHEKRALLICLFASFSVVSSGQATSPTFSPLFQYFFFYNLDLEINAAQPLDVKGPVFSNGGFWSGSPNVTFESTVWAVQNTYNQVRDPFANYAGSGQAMFNLAGQPVSGVAPVSFYGLSGYFTHAMLDWPPLAYAPGTASAYTTNGQIYLANQADLIVSNTASGIARTTPTGTNFTVYYQDPFYGNPLVTVPYDFYIVTNYISGGKPGGGAIVTWFTNYIDPSLIGSTQNIQYAGYTFLTNVVFYDWREYWNNGNGNSGKGKTVQAVQFNVAAFNQWLDNKNVNGTTNLNGGRDYNQLCQSPSHKMHPIDGIYIYSSVPMTTTTLPAVRVVNGANLYSSYGMSIATPFPLYVLGDYNVTDDSGSSAGQNSTTHARPAGLFGDSITILSSGWNDSIVSKRPASSSSTTVNAACIAGIVPSDKSLGQPSDDSDYSGGVENYFRLLETWGTFYFNGSIAALFPSQYATNRWRQAGYYYGAPTRKWAYDTNFNTWGKLPPLTPGVINSNRVPSIITQPTNQIILAGQNANFSVIAEGMPAPRYQWEFNGISLTNATNASLVLNHQQVTNAGNYSVQAINALGSVTSSNAVLSVYASAAATMNAVIFSRGSNFQFQVAGVPGFNYALESSSNLIDWTLLTTNVSPFNFTDTNTPNFPQQFYRSIYLPGN